MQHLPTPSPPRFSLPRPQSLTITFCGIFELIKESGDGGSDGKGEKKAIIVAGLTKNSCPNYIPEPSHHTPLQSYWSDPEIP